MNYDEMRRRDIEFLWHPYTEITSFEQSQFPIVESAEGCTASRNRWTSSVGWHLVMVVRKPGAQPSSSGPGNPGSGGEAPAHPPGRNVASPAIRLAEQLASIAPAGLGHAMFASDGSCAVEAALKIALQYWTNQGESHRTRFVTLKDGYHGDTLGTIGVGYIDSFHRPFLPALRPRLTALSPYCNHCPMGLRPESCHAECFDSMETLLRRHHAECAAVIVGPLCQAAAGMRIYPALYLKRLRLLCTEYGIPLIIDEVAVGFWADRCHVRLPESGHYSRHHDPRQGPDRRPAAHERDLGE